MKFKVVELFAGVGGFRVGLNNVRTFDINTGQAKESGKWDFVWANQWEPSTKIQPAFECYSTRFGKTDFHVNKDISLIEKKDIPNHDLLVGGFPCQDYSVARSLSNEKGINGKKGVLWWEIYNTLVEKNTQFILLENVDRLLKSPASHRGRDFAIMLKSLDNLGYIVEWRVINAAEYGMPQKRRRVFIYAYLKDGIYGKKIISKYSLDSNNEGVFPTFLDSSLLNKEFKLNLKGPLKKKDLNKFKDLADLTENYSSTEKKFENTGFIYNGVVYHSNYSEISEEISTLGDVLKESKKYYKNGVLEQYRVKDVNKWRQLKGAKSIKRTSKSGHEYNYSEGNMAFPDLLTNPGRTMLTSEATVNRSSHIIKMGNVSGVYRTITEIEAELLNMFPANWTNTGMTKRNRYFMMGNALVTGIISRIEPSLREALEININE